MLFLFDGQQNKVEYNDIVDRILKMEDKCRTNSYLQGIFVKKDFVCNTKENSDFFVYNRR